MVNNLQEALDDMKVHHRNKNVLLYNYINDRLNKSLKTYYEELTDSVSYLNNKDELKIMKRLNNYE